MTDVMLSGVRRIDVATEAARARVKARYRAETRFKWYGLSAIGLTALFLIVVLSDIVGKGYPAFFQNVMRLDVQLNPAEIDPKGTQDLAAIRAADYQSLVRDALRAQFPEVTERRDRRLLDALLSSGASDRLRERVVANPSLLGQTVKAEILLSSDADLYFKGIGTEIGWRAGRGTATPSGVSGEVSVNTNTDDFAAALLKIKQDLSARARIERNESQRLQQLSTRAATRKAGLEKSLETARAANNAARVTLFEQQIGTANDEVIALATRAKELQESAQSLGARFQDGSAGEDLTSNLPSLLIAINGGVVKVTKINPEGVAGDVILPLQSVNPALPGDWQIVTYVTPESNRRLSDRSVTWLERLKERGVIERTFNWSFFSSGDSREPELAGIRGALVGSMLTLFVTLALCLPIGVAGAIYLEEFAPKNWATEIVEVNINNLAAVPSIVFGLLGLAMFLNFFGLPRSAPLVGGLVLALLVLPTIIIASRAALKAVPPSIKEAALGVGASQQQAIFHHVLPLAMPGIMTGTIIGMAHALGETAPLLMIGMVAFIVGTATSVTDAATVLPVQIYLWSDLPEIGFQAKTAAAIMVLLAFLFVMNGAAIILRRRFERRW